MYDCLRRICRLNNELLPSYSASLNSNDMLITSKHTKCSKMFQNRKKLVFLQLSHCVKGENPGRACMLIIW